MTNNKMSQHQIEGVRHASSRMRRAQRQEDQNNGRWVPVPFRMGNLGFKPFKPLIALFILILFLTSFIRCEAYTEYLKSVDVRTYQYDYVPYDYRYYDYRYRTVPLYGPRNNYLGNRRHFRPTIIVKPKPRMRSPQRPVKIKTPRPVQKVIKRVNVGRRGQKN